MAESLQTQREPSPVGAGCKATDLDRRDSVPDESENVNGKLSLDKPFDVQKYVFRKCDWPAYAKLCYLVLYMHSNKVDRVAWPNYETIAEEMGVSKKVAISSVKTLEKAGAIKVSRRTEPGTKRAFVNVYTVFAPWSANRSAEYIPSWKRKEEAEQKAPVSNCNQVNADACSDEQRTSANFGVGVTGTECHGNGLQNGLLNGSNDDGGVSVGHLPSVPGTPNRVSVGHCNRSNEKDQRKGPSSRSKRGRGGESSSLTREKWELFIHEQSGLYPRDKDRSEILSLKERGVMDELIIAVYEEAVRRSITAKVSWVKATISNLIPEGVRTVDDWERVKSSHKSAQRGSGQREYRQIQELYTDSSMTESDRRVWEGMDARMDDAEIIRSVRARVRNEFDSTMQIMYGKRIAEERGNDEGQLDDETELQYWERLGEVEYEYRVREALEKRGTRESKSREPVSSHPW